MPMQEGNFNTTVRYLDRTTENKMGCLMVTVIIALASSCQAVKLFGPAPVVEEEEPAPIENYTPPRYAYNYAVNDPHSGDNKAQWEKREGGVVKGSYSLVEPDGNLRIVDYSADSHSGFNAVVKRVGPSLHPGPLPNKAAGPIAGSGAPKLASTEPNEASEPGKENGPTKATTTKWGSPAWDEKTASYDGWVPLKGKKVQPGGYVKITALKNGKEVWNSGPVKVEKGKDIIVRTKKD